jgi:hypothetical protein
MYLESFSDTLGGGIVIRMCYQEVQSRRPTLSINADYCRRRSASLRLRNRHRFRPLGRFMLDTCSLQQAFLQPGRLTFCNM